MWIAVGMFYFRDIPFCHVRVFLYSKSKDIPYILQFIFCFVSNNLKSGLVIVDWLR